MEQALTIDLVVMIAAASIGWAIIAYEGVAKLKGWPVGAWFSGPFSLLQLLAWMAFVGALVAAAVLGPWWHAVVVFVMSNIITRLIFSLSGPKVQIAVGVLVVPAIASIVWRLWFL